ncbi:pectin esterase [candidate division KSB1 bacterium]|nr:pectin esterase [candidate division KSB1 bacterium]
MRCPHLKFVLPILLILVFTHTSLAQPHADLIVDAAGNGDYKTISDAISSLSMYPYQRTIIFIRNGVYDEKIRIEQHYITLRGENRESTIIRYNQLRETWNNARDYIGPGVINIDGDDIVLDNLTIENTQPEIGPHAFAVYGLTGTRTIIINCNVISKGADTVSLWNYKHGMYYHANCRFEGAVDFVCPRGWCFVRDCAFYEVKQTAALWHAGNYDPDQKFVIRNSSFDGVEGFELGRHHYEAQFYLLDCRFTDAMVDRPIYWRKSDDPDKNNPYYEGDRTYFYHCQKAGQPYDWYADNLREAAGQPTPGQITPAWTFGGVWNPESTEPIRVINYQIDHSSLILTFNEIVTVRGKPQFRTKSGIQFEIMIQRFTDINRLTFKAVEPFNKTDLSGECTMLGGDIVNSIASVQERSIGPIFRVRQNKRN